MLNCLNWLSYCYSQIPVASWFDDFSDMELLELIPFLESINEADDVCAYLRNANMNTLKGRCNSLELNTTSWISSTPQIFN